MLSSGVGMSLLVAPSCPPLGCARVRRAAVSRDCTPSRSGRRRAAGGHRCRARRHRRRLRRGGGHLAGHRSRRCRGTPRVEHLGPSARDRRFGDDGAGAPLGRRQSLVALWDAAEEPGSSRRRSSCAGTSRRWPPPSAPDGALRCCSTRGTGAAVDDIAPGGSWAQLPPTAPGHRGAGPGRGTGDVLGAAAFDAFRVQRHRLGVFALTPAGHELDQGAVEPGGAGLRLVVADRAGTTVSRHPCTDGGSP